MTIKNGQTTLGLMSGALTQDVFIDLTRLYRVAMGIELTISREVDQKQYLADTLGQLSKCGRAEWRFGSCFSRHSKLIISRRSTVEGQDALRVELDPNNDNPPGSGIYPDGVEERRATFLQAVEAYLNEKGLAVELSDSW